MMLRVLGLAIMAKLACTQTAPPPSNWPSFEYQGQVTNKESLEYNPTNEFIFPSVFHAGAHLENPLGEWYLYYAPHENPGGICFVYSDSLEGPWTEYSNNPVISNRWDSHYSVPHVSSPEVIWNEAAGRMFLYFHGDNSQTRLAGSDDGERFYYGRVAVNNAMGGPNTTESSYARVFSHPNPASRYGYAMFYMVNEVDNIRRIRLAESTDGRDWVVDPDYLVEPGAEEGGNVSGANFWTWNGQSYIIYHGSSGKIYARTIDQTLRDVGTRPILLYQASGGGRTAAPDIVTSGGETYLFYESGGRLSATIAWAKAA
ncbi:hypothetical protein F66182_9273 [Fusarium sp. NRRL 66182]|nr:hypothetical protein F66182_9273 [Fusarium sp. NRRL 66182]